METILATAFGRCVDVQRGESTELTKSMETLIGGFSDGQIDGMFMIESTTIIGVFVCLFFSVVCKVNS